MTCLSKSDLTCLDRPERREVGLLSTPDQPPGPGVPVPDWTPGLCARPRQALGSAPLPAPRGHFPGLRGLAEGPLLPPPCRVLCAVGGVRVTHVADRGPRDPAQGWRSGRRTHTQRFQLPTPCLRPHEPLGTAPGHVCSCHRTPAGQAHPATARRRDSTLPGPGRRPRHAVRGRLCDPELCGADGCTHCA